MRRYAIRLVLFLLLGAIINVAVAWGLALQEISSSHLPNGSFDSTDECPWWGLDEYSLHGSKRLIWTAGHVDFRGSPGIDLAAAMGFARVPIQPPKWSVVDWRIAPSPGGVGLIIETASGWPNPSLASFASWNPTTRQFAQSLGLSIDRPFSTRCLPLRPLWPGFAINTIFYASILWLLFAAPGFVRGRIRRVRGRCLHCGYDLRGQPADSGKCPECGSPSPPGRGVRGEGVHGVRRA